MPETDFSRVEMATVQHNLDLAIRSQRFAHEALIKAAADTQHWRDLLARLEQQANANRVVHRK